MAEKVAGSGGGAGGKGGVRRLGIDGACEVILRRWALRGRRMG
jgi:hypothetical protein